MPFDAKGADRAGGGAKGIITKKIGPLPLWVYVVGGAAAVFLLRRRGSSSSSTGGSGIAIPTLTPGSATDLGGDGVSAAIGSPGQNIQGGSDTQPGAIAPPWWSSPPSWWSTGTGVGFNPADNGNTGNVGNQRNSTPGPAPRGSIFDIWNRLPAAVSSLGGVPTGGFTPAQQAGLIASEQRRVAVSEPRERDN